MNDTAHDSDNLELLDDAALEQRRTELQRDLDDSRRAIDDANRVIDYAEGELLKIAELLANREEARQKEQSSYDSLGSPEKDAEMDARWERIIRDQPEPKRDRAVSSLRLKAASIVVLGLLVGIIVGPSIGHDWRWTVAFPLGCALVAGWFAISYYEKHNDRPNDTN
jgi:hypothetical protein